MGLATTVWWQLTIPTSKQLVRRVKSLLFRIFMRSIAVLYDSCGTKIRHRTKLRTV